MWCKITVSTIGWTGVKECATELEACDYIAMLIDNKVSFRISY